MEAKDYLNKEVTVTDWSNYKESYSKNEDYPMKAVLIEITNYPCYCVRSLKTGLEYELYGDQIKEIEQLLNK